MATFSSNYSAILSFVGAGAGDLASVLTTGNTTGGTDIIFSDAGGGESDRLVVADNAGGAGFDFNLDGSDAGAATNTDGGDINLNPGMGDGTGNDGVVNVNGDLVVTGTITGTIALTNLIQGAGSPEGAVVASVSTIFQRTDGAAGNSVYFKMDGVGNTGWVPAGPHVFETFTATGLSADFTTGREVFDDPLALGVSNLLVYWNGVLQREGALDDYTVVYGGASATITLNQLPPANDAVTIQYLPA